MESKGMACLLLASLIMIISSCSRTPETGLPFAETEHPDMVLYDASYTLGEPDEDVLTLKAGTITMYSTGKDTTLENVSFERGTGLSGSCDSATVSHDNRKAKLSGNVSIVRKTDNISIIAQDIDWDDTTMTVSSNGQVSITYSDGTSIVAEGFRAKLDANDFEFDRILDGRISQ